MRPMIQSVLQTAGTFYYGRSMNCTALETFIVKCIKTVTSFASHVHVVDWFIDGSGFGHVCENKSANSTVHEDLFAWLYSRTNDTCAWIGKTIKNANCILNERTISKKKSEISSLFKIIWEIESHTMIAWCVLQFFFSRIPFRFSFSFLFPSHHLRKGKESFKMAKIELINFCGLMHT